MLPAGFAGRALGADAPDRSIVDLLFEIALSHPDRVACEDPGRELRFGELAQAVRRLATLVSAAAADCPGPVGILLPFGAAYLAALFACVAAGRPCVLLDARYPPERNQEVIRSTGVALLVVEDPAAGSTRDDNAIPLLLADRAFDACSPHGEMPVSPLDIDAPAFILCTSGSTGRPKSFVMSQRGALHRAAFHVNASVFGQDDRVTCLSPPSTVGGLFTMLGFPLAGAAIEIADLAQDGFRALLETFRSRKVTILRAEPPMLRMLAQLPGAADALASLRNVTVYGEALLLSDVALLRNVLPERCSILVAYGSTEAPGTGRFASPDDSYDPVRAPAAVCSQGSTL